MAAVLSPRASLTRWDGVTHAIVDILVVDGDYVDAAGAQRLARWTRKAMTVRLACARRSKYGDTADGKGKGNRITRHPVTCLWCAAERNL